MFILWDEYNLKVFQTCRIMCVTFAILQAQIFHFKLLPKAVALVYECK